MFEHSCPGSEVVVTVGQVDILAPSSEVLMSFSFRLVSEYDPVLVDHPLERVI
jgi:hypothetical protein